MDPESVSSAAGGNQGPRLLTRDEYAFFKMVLQTDPDFCLVPVVSFRAAFPHATWLLTLLLLSAVGGLFTLASLLVTLLCVLSLAGYLFGSRQQRITCFIKERSRRKQYSLQMKQILIESSTYEDYLRRIVRL